MPLTTPPTEPPAAPSAPGAAPSRGDRLTFRSLADSFVVWLVGFRNSVADLRAWLATYITWATTHVAEMDALQTDVSTKASQVATNTAAVATNTAAVATNTSAVQAIATNFGDVNAAITAASASATAAGASQVGAHASAVAAQAALDAINTTGKVFTAAEGTAAGITATTSGQQFAVVDASLNFWIVYRNNAGTALEVARNYTTAYMDSMMRTISAQNALGDAGQILWGLKDTSDRVALALLPSGKTLLDIDETSRAWAALMEAVPTVAVPAADVPDDNAIGAVSTITGSPTTSLESILAIGDTSRRVGLSLLSDGTLWIGKYDANLQALVQANQPTEYYGVNSGQITKFVGLAQTALTTLGTNSSPRPVGGKIQFQSDRLRGLAAAYEMARDGSNQRLLLGTQRAYEVVFITGQSLSTGETTTAITTTAPYPTSGLMLGGPPVVTGPSTRAVGSALVACRESTKETVATSFVAAYLDSELAQRSTLKHVMLGNGYPGKAYIDIKKGTATYADNIAQIAQVAAMGSTVVRAGIVIHGEGDATNAAYDANLIEWQADYEADVKAATGQNDPVFLLLSQTASIRSGFAPGTTTHKSALAQFAASEASSKIILAVSDYILTYAVDQVHIDALSQRLKGEYIQKAYKSVCIEGKDWRGVSPRTYTLGANFIDIQFWVPVAPLVLDTALCTDPGNYGFSYSDASGRTISSVALKGGTTDTVRVTLSGAIGAGAVIDYAYSNGTLNKSGKTEGARGCLRDSDPAVSRFDGSIHLYNPCVIFRKTLN